MRREGAVDRRSAAAALQHRGELPGSYGAGGRKRMAYHGVPLEGAATAMRWAYYSNRGKA